MREDGVLEIRAPGSGQLIREVPTVLCCHCGLPFSVQPGSGRIRGFCTRCMGPVCGPGCAECVPIEARLENEEAGRPVNARRIIVASGVAHVGA